MGWAHGVDENGLEVGYGVADICHHSECDEAIDRGLAYRCGPLGCEADPKVPGCGLYFCGAHLYFSLSPQHRGQYCMACLADAEGDWVEEVWPSGRPSEKTA